MTTIVIDVVLEVDAQTHRQRVTGPPETPVRVFVQEAFARAGVHFQPDAYDPFHNETPLTWDTLLPPGLLRSGEVVLVVRPTAAIPLAPDHPEVPIPPAPRTVPPTAVPVFQDSGTISPPLPILGAVQESASAATESQRPARRKKAGRQPRLTPAEKEEGDAGSKPQGRPRPTTAVVCYPSRMNPNRAYPLRVVLPALVGGSAQESPQGGLLQADRKTPVEVAVILPGCDVYPPRKKIPLGKQGAHAVFHVVPRIGGPVPEARVVVRQKTGVLTELPLYMRVVNPAYGVVIGFGAIFLPIGLALLRHYHIDLAGRSREGFSTYLTLLQTALRTFTPEGLAATLMVVAFLAYLWCRPRLSQVSWKIDQPVAQPGTGDFLAQSGRFFRSLLGFGLRTLLIGLAVGAILLALMGQAVSFREAFGNAGIILTPVLTITGFIALVGGVMEGYFAARGGPAAGLPAHVH
jgi:hypothetical protein